MCVYLSMEAKSWHQVSFFVILQVLSVNLELIDSPRWAGHWAPRTHLFLSPWCWDYRALSSCSAFTQCWGLEAGTSACIANTSPAKASSYPRSSFNIERGRFVSRQAVLGWTSTIKVLLDSKCFDDLFLLADEKVKQKDCMLSFLEWVE